MRIREMIVGCIAAALLIQSTASAKPKTIKTWTQSRNGGDTKLRRKVVSLKTLSGKVLLNSLPKNFKFEHWKTTDHKEVLQILKGQSRVKVKSIHYTEFSATRQKAYEYTMTGREKYKPYKSERLIANGKERIYRIATTDGKILSLRLMSRGLLKNYDKTSMGRNNNTVRLKVHENKASYNDFVKSWINNLTFNNGYGAL